MPVVVVDNATQLWDQMPSPPKARPPYTTWALENLKDRYRMTQNIIEDTENEQGISTLFIWM